MRSKSYHDIGMTPTIPNNLEEKKTMNSMVCNKIKMAEEKCKNMAVL